VYQVDISDYFIVMPAIIPPNLLYRPLIGLNDFIRPENQEQQIGYREMCVISLLFTRIAFFKSEIALKVFMHLFYLPFLLFMAIRRFGSHINLCGGNVFFFLIFLFKPEKFEISNFRDIQSRFLIKNLLSLAIFEISLIFVRFKVFVYSHIFSFYSHIKVPFYKLNAVYAQFLYRPY